MQTELYRGKRIDNNEWVYGNGVVIVDDDYVAIPKTKDVTSKDYAITLCKIRPETLGRYSTLDDKDGNKIFEGDFIHTTTIYGFHSDLMDEWKRMHDLPTINGIGSLFGGIVVIDEKRGIMLKRGDNDYMEPLFNRNQKLHCYLDVTKLEIKGNIHDNPEYLGKNLETEFYPFK